MTEAPASNDDMSWLFKDMKGITVLSVENERSLMRKAQKGDREARRLLIWHNLPLVVKEASNMVRRHKSTSSDKVDLMQSAISEGAMGVHRAIIAFSLDRGTKFSTYAMWHIREAIRRALVFDRNSTKPIKTLERAKNVTTNITMLSFIVGPDGENFDTEDNTSTDISEDLNKENLKNSLKDALRSILSNKERYIIEQRYGFHGIHLTFADVATLLDLSTERVRQIENGALRKLWHHLKRNELLHLEQKELADFASSLEESIIEVD